MDKCPYVIDGLITATEVDHVTALNIPGLGISDLTGIEAFVSLRNLFAQNNNLNTIDVSNNSDLRYLYIQNNNLNFELTLTHLDDIRRKQESY